MWRGPRPTSLPSGYGVGLLYVVYTVILNVEKFLSFLPTKDLAAFSYTYPTKKPLFKPINDQVIVAGIY